MPNHVKNILKMKGLTTLPLFTDKESWDKKMVPALDFSKIIPMPESLDMVSGTIERVAVEAAVRKAAGAAKKTFGGPHLRPGLSDSEYETWRSRADMSEDELVKLGAQYLQNLILYGATTWYDWRVEHWGTKWNSYENTQIDPDTITFETAWSAPEPVIAQLAKMYPDAEIEHWWADEDTGSNDGYARYSGGEAVEFVEYEQNSSEAFATYILCWGESPCLYQDEHGTWCRRNCGECHGCD